jgi:hypothetical protein
MWVPPKDEHFRVITATSATTVTTGDQTPVFYMDRSGTILWAAVSGASGTAGQTVDLKKNGTTQYSSATKPAVPGGGGVSAQRAPDNGSFRVAAGDYLTVSFSATTGPVVVYIGLAED